MNRVAPFIVLFAVVIVLQPLLIALDCVQTPASVAKNFIKDYYALDADMQKYMCSKEGDPQAQVNNYIYGKQAEAAQRGFNISYVRQLFTHIHVETKHQDADTAEVHITGTTRTGINHAFMVVGKLFFIGKNYPVDASVHLVKDNGKWQVCGIAMGINT